MRRLLLSCFVISLSVGISGLILPIYAAKEFNASYTQIGMLGMAYVIFDVILSVPLGRAGDRRGRKSFIVCGFLGTAFVLLAYSVATSIVWILVLRLIQGITEVPIWVNIQSAVAEQSSEKDRGRAMGAYATSWASGIGIGPIVGGVLYATFGAKSVFLVSGAVALIAVALAIPVSMPVVHRPQRKINFSYMRSACLAAIIYVGFVSLLFTILPVYAIRTLGMSEIQVGVLITMYCMTRPFLFTPLGKLSDKVGRKPVILTGIIGASLVSAGISLTTGHTFLAILVFLMSICEALVYPAVVSTVSRAAGGGGMGIVIGIFNAVAMVGWAIFPAVGGPLADSFGPAVPFLIFAIIGFISVPILWKLLPKDK
jgi:MFS family permease